MNATLIDEGDGVVYETVPGAFAKVRPACPRCPWRGQPTTAATYKWRMWIAMDIRMHTCTAPDQERLA